MPIVKGIGLVSNEFIREQGFMIKYKFFIKNNPHLPIGRDRTIQFLAESDVPHASKLYHFFMSIHD